jgi:hypothetical protein
MNKRSLGLPLIVTLVLLINVAAPVYALDDVSNMDCDNGIAETGDQQFDFQRKCGPPTTTEQNGQVWIYDRRPEDYVYYVTFSEGQVERIQVGNGD